LRLARSEVEPMSRSSPSPIATLTMNPSLDIATSTERVVPTDKLRCEPPRRDPGGGGINVARVVHILGGRATAIHPAGGATGSMFEELLAQAGVGRRMVQIGNPTREASTIDEAASGKQFRFVLPGPELTEEEAQRCLDELAALEPRPAFVVANGSLPPGVPDDFYARVARLTRELGVRLEGGRPGLPAAGQPRGRQRRCRARGRAGQDRRLRRHRRRGCERHCAGRHCPPGVAALTAEQFAPGSIGPKVEGATKFAAATGHSAAIGHLEEAVAILRCDAGTRIDGAGSEIEIRR
jgi:hypothetical protein